MTKKRDIKKDLEPSAGDYVHAGMRAGLSFAPILGGSLGEFFSIVIAPPLNKRRDGWMIEIYTHLKRLEKQIEGFKIKDLAKDEKFISSLFYATQVAMRTHHKEKLEALRNALLNSLFHPDINESQQLIYLNLIDRYSPWHLKILDYFYKILLKSSDSDTNLSKIDILSYTRDTIETKFPELIGNQDFYEQIVKELVSQGLLEITTSYGKTMTNQKVAAFEMTEMGKNFLNFIKDPNQPRK